MTELYNLVSAQSYHWLCYINFVDYIKNMIVEYYILGLINYWSVFQSHNLYIILTLKALSAIIVFNAYHFLSV